VVFSRKAIVFGDETMDYAQDHEYFDEYSKTSTILCVFNLCCKIPLRK